MPQVNHSKEIDRKLEYSTLGYLLLSYFKLSKNFMISSPHGYFVQNRTAKLQLFSLHPNFFSLFDKKVFHFPETPDIPGFGCYVISLSKRTSKSECKITT